MFRDWEVLRFDESDLVTVAVIVDILQLVKNSAALIAVSIRFIYQWF